MFTMPSIGMLTATLKGVAMQPGISKLISEVLKKEIGQMKNSKHRLCTLIFDEIAIQPHLDYLPHEDRCVGFEDDGWARTQNLVDHVCVFMLRGIYKR